MEWTHENFHRVFGPLFLESKGWTRYSDYLYIWEIPESDYPQSNYLFVIFDRGGAVFRYGYESSMMMPHKYEWKLPQHRMEIEEMFTRPEIVVRGLNELLETWHRNVNHV